MWLLMNDLGLKARLAFSKFMCDEEGDVNIVSIVVLIGIRLTCSYDVKVVNLLNTDITIRFCQSASTDVWGKGVSAKK